METTVEQKLNLEKNKKINDNNNKKCLEYSSSLNSLLRQYKT